MVRSEVNDARYVSMLWNLLFWPDFDDCKPLQRCYRMSRRLPSRIPSRRSWPLCPWAFGALECLDRVVVGAASRLPCVLLRLVLVVLFFAGEVHGMLVVKWYPRRDDARRSRELGLVACVRRPGRR